MNCLKLETKIQVLNCLIEGNSIRSTERMTGVHRDTIMRLLSQVGFVKSFPTRVTGNPNPDRVSTSYIERQNLTMRMQMRRFTRLTNAFSKKLGNLKAAVALHFAHYNFMRIHKSLRCTPAMQAGIADHVWTWEELLTAI